MSWINLAYLGVGLGLGWGSAWFSQRRQTQTEASVSLAETPSSGQDSSTEELQRVREQLKYKTLACRMATEMSQFKAGFLARTSHELRSPLNGLIGMHQLILSDLCDDPTEERDFIDQANKSALKMVKVLDEILEVAKTEYGSSRLDIQPLQLAQMFQAVHQLTHLQAQNRNLRLSISLPDPEIYVLADPRWLKQVMLHLVDTAIAQMQEGKLSLTAEVAEAAGYVHLWLDAPVPVEAWSEPVDLLPSPDHQPPTETDGQCSRGMTLLLDQTVLELMQGRLEVLAVPAPTDSNEATPNLELIALTRIQCSIPLLQAEE